VAIATADPEEVRTTDCILISASCTTSWLDWIHGELWLCANGLLRRSLGLKATIRHNNRRTVEAETRPRHEFNPGEIAEVLRAGRRNRWITWPEITHATLKRGVLDHSLHLERARGRREKLLWLHVDGGYDVLEAAPSRSLPGRFEARDKAFG
jgi:hypothetical protein